MIEVSEREGVALLRLAHGKANAMSLDFCEALTARFAAMSSARAVVLTGTGAIFSAGVDLVRLLEGGGPYIRKFLPALSTMLGAWQAHTSSRAHAGHCVRRHGCRRGRASKRHHHSRQAASVLRLVANLGCSRDLGSPG